MPLIRIKSRRSLALSFTAVCVAAALLLMLFLAVCAILIHKQAQLDSCLDKLQNPVEAYILTKPVKSGDMVEQSCIQTVYLSGLEKKEDIVTVGKDLHQKRYIADLKAGTILCEELIYEGDVILQDLREYCYTGISLNGSAEDGDYVDIRICFPDGEDYIVLKHKKIIRAEQQENSTINLILMVSEEELMRINSARVDSIMYSGANVYALSYINWSQKEAAVTYPVNARVFTLMGWDPNMLNYNADENEKEYRRALERNMEGFLNNKTEYRIDDNSSSGTAFFPEI